MKKKFGYFIFNSVIAPLASRERPGRYLVTFCSKGYQNMVFYSEQETSAFYTLTRMHQISKTLRTRKKHLTVHLNKHIYLWHPDI